MSDDNYSQCGCSYARFVRDEIARLTAEGKELREQLATATAAYDRMVREAKALAEEKEEARRRLGLAQEWLMYDTCSGPDQRNAVLERREAFRASLPAKPSGGGNG